MFLGLLLAAAALLLLPLSASAAEYKTFVGCDDLSPNPIPSHECQIGDFPGAYFESDVETEFEICVEFPDAEILCLDEQLAEAGVLYINSITSEIEGDHFVSWFVEGVEIGSWGFRMNAPAPPPPPVTPAPASPTPPALAPTPSAECLKAERRVGQLKNRLKKATGRKQRSRIRAKLRKARAAAKNLC